MSESKIIEAGELLCAIEQLMNSNKQQQKDNDVFMFLQYVQLFINGLQFMKLMHCKL
jgi:hypothetical protein